MKFTKRKVPQFLKTHGNTIGTFAGVLAGIALGFILRQTRSEPWTQKEVRGNINAEGVTILSK